MGRYGSADHSRRAPSRIAYFRTSWLMSMTWASGVIPRMTPLQIAAEGSRSPKSVSSEIIGRLMGWMVRALRSSCRDSAGIGCHEWVKRSGAGRRYGAAS